MLILMINEKRRDVLMGDEIRLVKFLLLKQSGGFGSSCSDSYAVV